MHRRILEDESRDPGIYIVPAPPSLPFPVEGEGYNFGCTEHFVPRTEYRYCG